MNPKWLKLAGQMLEQASERMANDGCDDWKWPDGWSGEERRELLLAMTEDNYGKPLAELPEAVQPEELHQIERRSKGEYGPPNWWVAGFLARALLKEVEGS